MKNGYMWYDDQGNTIQAHGGMILRHGEKWYWYGENKDGPTKIIPGELNRVDVIGISCYSSVDLMHWHYEGLALPVSDTGMLRRENVCERPKVIYNRKTGKFVMWFHCDTPDYVYGGVGVAVSDSPEGTFELLYTGRPNRQDSRDMTIFEDLDGTAWLVHSTNWNKTMDIARLTEDYLHTDGFYVSVLIDQEREAPALVYEQGKYYMVTSGCTGWTYNSALVAECDHLLGQWKLTDNPCEGEGYRDTFGGQSTYIFRVGEQLYLMLDHWKPEDLRMSGYSILPLKVENGRMTVTWTEYPPFYTEQRFAE